jgi:hypothetical protein
MERRIQQRWCQKERIVVENGWDAKTRADDDNRTTTVDEGTLEYRSLVLIDAEPSWRGIMSRVCDRWSAWKTKINSNLVGGDQQELAEKVGNSSIDDAFADIKTVNTTLLSLVLHQHLSSGQSKREIS